MDPWVHTDLEFLVPHARPSDQPYLVFPEALAALAVRVVRVVRVVLAVPF